MLLATLLPDPGDYSKRQELCDSIGGKLLNVRERPRLPSGECVEREKLATEGGILRWRREKENAQTLEQFRRWIMHSFGERRPRVLDPFSGGGAIPLEAMRLGCETTANDINPVAWFILKCTLGYPQRLSGKTLPIPALLLQDDAFMAEFFAEAKGYSKAETKAALKRLHNHFHKSTKQQQDNDQTGLPFADDADEAMDELKADLSWHVRAWGRLVFAEARRELAQYYPIYADFEPLKKDHVSYEQQPTRLLPLKDDGTADVDSLNSEFTAAYLKDDRNPRWIAKPTLAYLWARTVTCKNCRATVPLLKTRWLCKKSNKRVLLAMEQNADKSGIMFGVERNVPIKGGNAAQRREHDKRIGAGTMSSAGASCPCCKTIMTMADLRVEGLSERISQMLIAVVRSGPAGKEFDSPTSHETNAASVSTLIPGIYSQIPFGAPTEPLASAEALGFRIPLYGYCRWSQLFSDRQLIVLGVFARCIRSVAEQLRLEGINGEWKEAIQSYLACTFNKVADYNSAFVAWQPVGAKGANTFQRWALPMKWDYVENNVLDSDSGGWQSVLEWVAKPLDGLLHDIGAHAPAPQILRSSATGIDVKADVIMTDPPYYDAIGYSDLMDFFYVWLRRLVFDLSDEHSRVFAAPLSPKWDGESNDGELIDEASRHSGDRIASKRAYEEGMYRVFQRCHDCLVEDGRLVIVFAHKHPDAWETLVSAIIRAGFVVDGSWPIQTEMVNRTRAMESAALASSVWLVCKKRPATARPGWDNNVLEEMRTNIAIRLREYWDAGIRGPDFVWAATGPAMEAYSKHPVVRKANEPNATMGVGEFLNHVRRIVVDYVVGQVLTGEQGSDLAAADRLDEVTAYYLLHRHDFGLEDAPVGACILYATACGLSDAELDRTWDILARTRNYASASGVDEEESD